MLKDRVITAAIIIPLLVTAILLLSTNHLSYVFGALIAIGAWEWSRLSGFTSSISRLAYVGITILVMVSSYDWILHHQFLRNLLLLVFICWLFAFVWLTITPAEKMLSNAINVYLRGAIGLVLLVPAWLALLVLHSVESQGPYIVLSLFVLIGVADSGAYFAGRSMGLTKLAPVISPGKTLEGVYGALTAGAITAFIIGYLFDYSGINLVSYISVALLCIVFSIVGDLFESVTKRSAGVKDSGSLFPGHGGVLDRIDSLTAAAPLYLLGLSWFPSLQVY
jgi:phosphatidate cytidylyltransferase